MQSPLLAVSSISCMNVSLLVVCTHKFSFSGYANSLSAGQYCELLALFLQIPREPPGMSVTWHEQTIKKQASILHTCQSEGARREQRRAKLLRSRARVEARRWNFGTRGFLNKTRLNRWIPRPAGRSRRRARSGGGSAYLIRSQSRIWFSILRRSSTLCG